MRDNSNSIGNRLHVIVFDFFGGCVEILGPFCLGLLVYLNVNDKGAPHLHIQLARQRKGCELCCCIVVHGKRRRKRPARAAVNVIQEMALALVHGENLLQLKSTAINLEVFPAKDSTKDTRRASADTRNL